MISAQVMTQKLREAKQFCSLDIFTDERGAAFLLGISQRTLRGWRACGEGPPATLTSRYLYDIEDLVAWMSAGGKQKGMADTGNQRQDAETVGSRSVAPENTSAMLNSGPRLVRGAAR